MDGLRIIKTNGSNPDFINLCQKLDCDLNEIVGATTQKNKYDKFNTLDSIHDVIIIYKDNEVIGSGAYKPYDETTVEIKRIYIDHPYRGLGLSKLLLKALEDDAFNSGYKYAILETGKQLIAASSLYRSIGYELIPNYGQYKDMPNSICMKKKLS